MFSHFQTNPNFEYNVDVSNFGLMLGIASGYLTVCHGIDGPSIDGLPIKKYDFPWLC